MVVHPYPGFNFSCNLLFLLRARGQTAHIRWMLYPRSGSRVWPRAGYEPKQICPAVKVLRHFRDCVTKEMRNGKGRTSLISQENEERRLQMLEGGPRYEAVTSIFCTTGGRKTVHDSQWRLELDGRRSRQDPQAGWFFTYAEDVGRCCGSIVRDAAGSMTVPAWASWGKRASVVT